MTDTTGKAQGETMLERLRRMIGSSDDQITIWLDREGIGAHQDGICSAAELLDAVDRITAERDRMAGELAKRDAEERCPACYATEVLCEHHKQFFGTIGEFRKLEEALDAERVSHHKTLDSAEKAAEHIELQTLALRAATEWLEQQSRQIESLTLRERELVRALRWIATVNTTLDLNKFDPKMMRGLVEELRAKAQAALRDSGEGK